MHAYIHTDIEANLAHIHAYIHTYIEANLAHIHACIHTYIGLWLHNMVMKRT